MSKYGHGFFINPIYLEGQYRYQAYMEGWRNICSASHELVISPFGSFSIFTQSIHNASCVEVGTVVIPVYIVCSYIGCGLHGALYWGLCLVFTLHLWEFTQCSSRSAMCIYRSRSAMRMYRSRSAMRMYRSRSASVCIGADLQCVCIGADLQCVCIGADLQVYV